MVDNQSLMEIISDPVLLSVFIALIVSSVTTVYIVCRRQRGKVSFVKCILFVLYLIEVS